MTFVMGGPRLMKGKDADFYMDNPSVWVTKKTSNKGGPLVYIKVEGLMNRTEMPTFAAKGFSETKSGISNIVSGPGMFRQGGLKARFLGYLPNNSDATVTFDCKTKEGPVVFQTTLQTLADAGPNGLVLKTSANGASYAYRVSAAKTVIGVQVPPMSAAHYLSVPAYKIKIHQFMKVGAESSEAEGESNEI
jgi:hypothetical protein